MDTYYLVDFENVRSLGLDGCEKTGKSDHIVIFFTKNADKIAMTVLTNHGQSDLKVMEVEAGKQSLDHHISSYAGYLLGMEKCRIAVISKDKDFDGIIAFWKKEIGADILRAEDIGEVLSSGGRLAAPTKTKADGNKKNETLIKEIFKNKFNKKPYKANKDAIIKAFLTSGDKQTLNNKLTKIISTKHIPALWKGYEAYISKLPNSAPENENTVSDDAIGELEKREMRIRTVYGTYFKTGTYKEMREEIISVLVNSKTKTEVNSDLCRLIPSEDAGKIIKQFKPILDELPSS